MSFIIIGDESFNSDAIKVVQRIKIDDGYAVRFYVNIGNIGKLFELPFNDLLKRDDNASSIAYNFIVSCVTNKRGGVLNLALLCESLSKLYRETLKTYSESAANIGDINVLRDNIMQDYFKAINRLAEGII